MQIEKKKDKQLDRKMGKRLEWALPQRYSDYQEHTIM